MHNEDDLNFQRWWCGADEATTTTPYHAARHAWLHSAVLKRRAMPAVCFVFLTTGFAFGYLVGVAG